MRRMWKRFKNEKAAVSIVEGAIVFPVVLFTVVFLLFLGNAMHEKSKIDSIVVIAAVKGAQTITDPFNTRLVNDGVNSESGVIPPDSGYFKDSKPYRYFFGINSVESEIRTFVEDKIASDNTRLFEAQRDNAPIVKAKYNNNILAATFSVEVDFSYELPFKWAFMELPPVIEITSKAEVPVNDSPEFIRNTDMVIDYAEQTGAAQKIRDIMKKVGDYFNIFGRKS
ncbi:MAG: pilus assembly protein [Bacteroidales bacterium]|jgi:hypothetical protein|nr:pilus assembly protein [Bacteroidales bacterium]HPC99870.1 hypothetical protein [Acetivibrio sp.]